MAYKCFYNNIFSNYSVILKSTYDSEGQHTAINKIYSVSMQLSGRIDHKRGFAMPEDKTVFVDVHPYFWVIRLGEPKSLLFPNEDAYSFIRDELKKNHGLLAYWDFNSIAFITDRYNFMGAFKWFLENIQTVTYGAIDSHKGAPSREGIVIR